jgi:hypothetical protein
MKFENWLKETTRSQSDDNPDMSPERIEELLRADHVMGSPLYGWRPPDTLTNRILEFASPHHSSAGALADLVDDEWAPGYHYTDMGLLEPTAEEPINVPDASAFSEDVQLLIAMRAGGIAPAHAAALAQVDVAINAVTIRESQLSQWFEFAWQPYSLATRGSIARDLTPFGRTLSGCSFFHPVVNWDERTFPIVVGGTADDFGLALALDRLLDGAAWLPPSLLESEPTRTAALSGIGRTIWNLASPARVERPIAFMSASETKKAIAALQEDISRNSLYGTIEAKVVDAKSFDVPDVVQRIWDVEANRIARVEPFLGTRQATRLETPTPGGVEQRRTSLPGSTPFTDRYFTWEVDVWIDQFQMPARACLAEHLIEEGTFDRDIRASRDGVSYFSQTGFVLAGESMRRTLSRPRLTLPSPVGIFTALLARHGLKCEVSQAGRYLQSMVDLWGGIDELVEVFRQAPFLRMLQAFLGPAQSPSPTGSPDTLPDRVHLRGVNRTFLTFGSMAAASALPEDELREVVDDWTVRGALRRGLVLKCGTCMYANWYSVDEIGHSFRCPRCRAETSVTQKAWRRPASEPYWYYQLAEVAYQAIDNDAHATALALGTLKEGTRSFVWAPELLVLNSNDERVSEHDIWAFIDGAIVVGEANTTGNFGSNPSKRIRRLRDSAVALSADETVLATTAARWSPAVVTQLKRTFRGTEARLRLLTQIQP